MTAREIWERVHDECIELRNAVFPDHAGHVFPRHILKESIDVANFAMVVADKVREYVEPEAKAWRE